MKRVGTICVTKKSLRLIPHPTVGDTSKGSPTEISVTSIWALPIRGGAYLIFVISFTQAGFFNPKFYTQKMIKNTKNVPEKSILYAVFAFNLKFFTPDRIFFPEGENCDSCAHGGRFIQPKCEFDIELKQRD